MAIKFHFDKKTKLSNRRVLKQFLSRIFILEKRICISLDFVFCSDDFLLKINQDYLNHDYFTDIITFDLTDPGSKKISGEVYISVEMVTENAKRFGVDFEIELYRVMCHGILHLCGYGDKTREQKITMRKKEDFYLKSYLKIINA